MFNVNPVNPVRENHQIDLKIGLEQIIESIVETITTRNIFHLVIDGTNGAPFKEFAAEIHHHLQGDAEMLAAEAFLKSDAELRHHFQANITDNRAFGYVAEGEINEYFRADSQAEYCNSTGELNQSGQRTITYGTGSGWLSEKLEGETFTVFLDLSREKQQALYKESLLNFGSIQSQDFVEKYKISLFVEWPILEKYRKNILKKMDYYIDFNKPQQPVMITAEDLMNMTKDISKYPMRVKPFFAPGVWGGQYLKDLADLPKDWVNCAWSFEPIAPENSILIGCGDEIVEIPFLIVMDHAHLPILGQRNVELFGDFFPIRFDYLDTIGGTNLSCQVHPKQAYIKDKFNYPLEQQESYYMMEKKEGSKVYLGLTEDCDQEEFLEQVELSQESGKPIEFTNYVKEWECEKGDLFLIPTGTVHCSGSENLVLEISSTTWWFTFKIYDYVRKDLDGKPRPINIDHAKENIDWYKTESWVKENLIQKPALISSQDRNQEYVLGAREDLLFYVHRIHLEDRWQEDTQGELMLLNLVEGEKIGIRSLKDSSVMVELSYAESYILPAVFGEFEIENLGSSPCKIIKAGVSPQWDVKILDE